MSHLDNGILDSFEKVTGAGKNLSKSKLFVVETANESIRKAKKLDNPKRMVGNFWKEGELFVLFAFTGTGKTVFSYAIAKALSEGKDVLPILPNECSAKKVLYYDAELSLKQFENRFSEDYKNHVKFSDNLYRMYIDRHAVLSEGQSIADSIIPEIENCIKSNKINVVIIDNLSTLKSGIEQSTEAKPLMDLLVGIKHKYNVSLMIVGHTPKQHHYKEMILADLQGSAHLSIQLDTCVAMGNSAIDQETKYFKEVKMRDGKYLFGSDNVITVELVKNGMLSLIYKATEDEQNHLKNIDIAQVTEDIINLSNNGMSIRDIENYVPFKKSKIAQIIKENEAADSVSTVESKDNKDTADKQLKINSYD